MHRKSIYLSWIKNALVSLLDLQDRRAHSSTRGCFFYPYWRGKEKYSNARWQEAVFALAWMWQREKDEELKKRVVEGIDFWCRLQHADGSFPEYSRHDRSFAATAFSTYALLKASQIIGLKDSWLESLDKAGRWLSANDERYLDNQEAMAALTLLELHLFLKKTEFLRKAEKKLESVLNRFSKKGFFWEKNGFDLGYSSLTLSILGNYYIKRKDERIRKVAKRCISLIAKFIYPDGSFGGTYNSRQVGWIILDGLEIFSSEIEEAQRVLNRLFRGHLAGVGDLAHLPTSRHLCTDLYRLSQAYDHAVVELAEDDASIGSYDRGREILPEAGLEIIRMGRYIAVTDIDRSCLYSLWTQDGIKIFFKSHGKPRERLLNLLRPLGIHHFRGMRNLPRPSKGRGLPILARTPETNCRYDFSKGEIKVRIDQGEEELLFAYGEPYIIEKEESRIVLKGKRNIFAIYPTGYVETEDLGKISVEDSIFYGDKALGFLRIRMKNPSPRASEYILKIT